MVTDSAVKVLALDTLDGRTVVAYAGLGMTASGTQPSDWMSACLRGRSGINLEQALGVLAHAALREFPPHLIGISSHLMVAPSLMTSGPARMYTIGVGFDTIPRQARAEFKRSVHPGTNEPQRLKVTGSGATFLRGIEAEWIRPLRSLLKANDRGKVSDLAVADWLAALNYRVHLGTPDNSVGPNSLVIWRRRDRARNNRGSAHQWYSGTSRVTTTDESMSIPTIGNGFDVTAIANIFMSLTLADAEQGAEGLAERFQNLVQPEIDRQVRNLPWEPDERLT